MALVMADWLAGGRAPLAALGDEEGARVDAELPPVWDAHVHVFPDRLFQAVWRWFAEHGWPIRYPLLAPEVASFLLSRGVERAVLLHYAHKPGIARSMNTFVAELCGADPRLIGLATVLPGEPGVADIVAEAARLGLRGIKLHCHVQAFAPDSEEAAEVLGAAEQLDMPVVIHAGREPRSPALPVDTYAVCAAERTERVLRRFPRLRVCVPHFGGDEFDDYAELLDRFDNLYLDTTMMLSGFFTGADVPVRLLSARPERILYGTDFPNIPYAWDRELRVLRDLRLPDAALGQVLAGTARDLFVKAQS
ncbi:MAG: amidohydrolase [Myxococcales bacterium]|nr:amidohydrolase [Myxococcales bacterium]